MSCKPPLNPFLIFRRLSLRDGRLGVLFQVPDETAGPVLAIQRRIAAAETFGAHPDAMLQALVTSLLFRVTGTRFQANDSSAPIFWFG
jgi:hypothetical protein